MTPTKLQQAIAYVVLQMGAVNRTNLVKLIYLADECFFNEFGKQLTEAKYCRQEMGPLPVHFNTIVDEMRGKEILISEQPVGTGKALVHKPGPKPRFSPDFSPDEARILNNVVRLFGRLTKQAIIDVVYKTKPMQDILSQEREGGKLLGHHIQFEQFVPGYILRRYATSEGLDLSVRGEASKLADRDMEIYHNTLAIRQKATRHAQDKVTAGK